MRLPRGSTTGLLERDRWIRQLAIAVASDGVTAEDLAQETWLRALQVRGGAPPHDPGAWFATLLRNAAHNLRRSVVRQRARERQAVRPERDAAPEPFEFAAYEERRGELVRAIGELPAAHREVVLARYWEGLLPIAIARRTGETPAAVRQRLRRALAALRARLDRESHGARAAWLGPLLGGAPVPGAGGAGVLLGGLAMKKLMLAGAAMLCFLLGMFAWSPWSDAAPAARSSPVPTAVEQVRAGAEEPAAAQRTAVAPAADAPAATVLLDADRAPLAGAAYWADERPFRMHHGRAPVGAPRTDAGGRFDAAGLGAGDFLWFEIDEGLSLAVERHTLAAQPVVQLPRRREVEVEIRSLPTAEAWRIEAWPAWYDDGDPTLNHGTRHVLQMAHVSATPVWVARRRMQRQGASGPARTRFLLVEGLPAAFTCSAPRYDVMPDVQEVADPRHVVAEAGAGKLVLPFAVVEADGTRSTIGGRAVLSSKPTEWSFSREFTQGRGTIERSAGDDNAGIDVAVVLDDGEVFERAFLDAAGPPGPEWRLVRGSGRAPARSFAVDAEVAGWPDPQVWIEAGAMRAAKARAWFVPIAAAHDVAAWLHAGRLVLHGSGPEPGIGRVLVVAADGHVARDVGDAVVAMPSHEMQPILPQALIDRLAVPSGIDMLLVQHQLELPGIPGPVHGWFAARSLRLHRVSGFGWRLSRTAEIDVHEALPAAVKTFAPTAARSRLFVRAFGAGDTVLEHERLR